MSTSPADDTSCRAGGRPSAAAELPARDEDAAGAELEAFDALADVLEYPRPKTSTLAFAAAGLLAPGSKPLATAIRALSLWLGEDLQQAEERYTRLFDLAPVCSLHVGWHLFGDDYARGVLLSKLQVELRSSGVRTNGDLPDHLPLLLRLMARRGAEDRSLLVEKLLQPGLVKIGAALAESSDPYSDVLRALPGWLEHVVASAGPEVRAGEVG